MIILIGVAGTGKSTQGQLLADYLNCPWLSVGSILRAHMSGRYAKKMLAGELIEDSKMLPLLDDELKRLHASTQELILDGSPRTIHQVEWLSEKVKSREISLTAVIHLRASQETARKRLLARSRPDDHEQAIDERFKEYHAVIMPILKYMRKQKFKIYDIDAEQSQKEVADDIHKALGLSAR